MKTVDGQGQNPSRCFLVPVITFNIYVHIYCYRRFPLAQRMVMLLLTTRDLSLVDGISTSIAIVSQN